MATPAYDKYHRWYKTQRWLRIRRMQLRLKPLCEKCDERGRVEPADSVHHVIPHKGDMVLFYTGKLMSLCKRCHDGITQQQERYGFTFDIGPDGWPLDPKHPVYQERS